MVLQSKSRDRCRVANIYVTERRTKLTREELMPATTKQSKQAKQSVKQMVKAVLRRLPEDCTLEDVQYEIYVLQTIQRRLELSERGDFLTQEEVERRVEKWLAR